MRIYFLSARPASLTIGGAYMGMVNDFEKFADVSLSDNLYALFSPEDALPVGVFLSESLLFHPPKNVNVYVKKDGLYLFVQDYPPSDFSLQVLKQERFLSTLITVFFQGSLQISVESEEGFFLYHPIAPLNTVSIVDVSRGFLIVGEKRLVLLTKTACVFDEEYSSYDLNGNVLTVYAPAHTHRRALKKTDYDLSDPEIKKIGYSLIGEDTLFEDDLIPYAFFESISVNGDYENFLADELKEKKEYLRDFIGDFLYAEPTDCPSEIAVCKQKCDRVFSFAYFSVEMKDGKITDIKTE